MAKFDITIVGAEPTNRVVSVFTVETVTESMVEALEVFDETVAPTIEYPFFITGAILSIETAMA